MTRIPQFLAAACAAAFFGVFLAYADDFTGQAPKDTYKKILHLDQATNTGLDTTLRDVHAGDGTVSKLQLSNAKVNIAVDALQIAGTDVGATAAELNILDGVTATTAEVNVLAGLTATTAEVNVLAGATLTDGAVVLGNGTGALQSLTVTTDGAIVIGDGATDPTTLSAFTSSTGTLKHEQGGLETDISAIIDNDFIVGTGAGTLALENPATARTSLGLGTAAVVNTGVASGQVPLMDATGYPTADGSQITGLAAPAKNGIINGGFRVAQRGTSFTATTTPANNDDTYLLDRWILLSDGNDAVDVTQETTTVPTGAYAATRLDVETADVKFGKLQVLEARDAAALIGGTASFSFKARRTGTSIDHLRVAILAWDGAADAVTSDVVSAWNAAGADPTLVANWTYENTPANLATLTTSYQTFRIEGISIDTSGATNVAVFIWIDDVTTTVGDFLYIADVQFELGSIATSFERRQFTQELALCQRYYQKTFLQGTAPAQNAGTDGIMAVHADAAGDFILRFNFTTVMRAKPTLTTYNPSAANAEARNPDDSTDEPVGTFIRGDRLVIFTPTSIDASHASDKMQLHAQADAEL